jgi:hypothetical protein
MAMSKPLDAFMPAWDIRERHDRMVDAPPALVWEVARRLDLFSLPAVRAIFSARERLMRSTAPQRTPRPFLDEVQAIGWQQLEERPGECFVAGASCQPWQADVVFRPVPPAQFRDFAEPDQVKIAWTIEIEPRDGGARLVTETRVVATNQEARRRFLRYWRWARFGIIPIRWLMLRAIRAQAEAESRRREIGTQRS